jgi:hypothetical protein
VRRWQIVMPKQRIKRFFYRNGRIHTENREVEGQFHGRCRVWHRNGRLAEELRYHQGQLHGLSRQWDENGRLLGSFKMVHGTGVQQYRHNNGQLQSEITTRNGKFHGRTRGWLRDGTLIKEDYLIANRDVARATYLKAAEKHPDWPQYANESAGRVILKGRVLEQRTINLFAQSVLESSDRAKARTWLMSEAKPHSRSLAKFRTTKAALAFVEKLYGTGAESVVIFAISTGKGGKLFADALLIQQPESKTKRRALRKLCLDFCARRGGATLPDRELGETHLYMMLA